MAQIWHALWFQLRLRILHHAMFQGEDVSSHSSEEDLDSEQHRGESADETEDEEDEDEEQEKQEQEREE